MRACVSGKVGIRNQRGFWLRCFLSGALWVLVCAAVPRSSAAQIDIPGPERLTHVEGTVVDPNGHAAPNVEVTLAKPDAVTLAMSTRTNESGEFRFGKVKGDYILRIARTRYAPAERAIFVTDEVVTALERKKLYIILGPGACQDACSSVLTSKKDFDRIIRKNNRH
jgi:hypothetical protein